MKQKYHEFYRGEIYYADMNGIFASGAMGLRPVLILLTDQGLYNSPNVIVAETSHDNMTIKRTYPIDKCRLRGKAGQLSPRQMAELDTVLREKFYLDDSDYIPMEVEAP